ncbi:MAG TPA: branched-chain amino acid ABC transporter substrate-binding protein [Chloroflexia bacterium]|nr:branched-chain amino acid ABC transporter substrate-binding protein [Chloroflexia bacterium]
MPAKLLRYISGLTILVLLMAGCDSSPQSTPTFTGVIKIGVASPYTGDTADGGIQIWQGAQLAADEVNAQGGILGKQVVIVPADDSADPNKAVSVANSLVSQGIVAVIGHKDSGVSIPASAVYHAAGIVEITPTSSNPQLTAQGFDTVFRVCPIDKTQGPVLAEFMIQKLGFTSIAVIYANTAYGIGLDAEFEQRATALGVTPVTSQEINRGDKDFSATLKTIQPLNPQAIFYAGSLPEAIIIVQQMKELGIKATFVGGDTLFQPEFALQAGSASEGAYVSSFFPDLSQSSDQSAKNWVASYRDTFKRDPGGNSSGGYVAAKAAFQAIQNARSTDPAQIKAALKTLDMSSLIGQIAFDANGDLQDQRAHLHIFQVKDGAFVPVP